MQGKNLTEFGSRPLDLMASLEFLITLVAWAMVDVLRNIASACLAAKADPDFDEPAWKSTGVR